MDQRPTTVQPTLRLGKILGRQAQRAPILPGYTLQHYLAIGSVRPLQDQSDTRGVWSAFFPVPKKGTDKMRGCIDLTTINPYLKYEHFKMEGLHTV